MSFVVSARHAGCVV